MMTTNIFDDDDIESVSSCSTCSTTTDHVTTTTTVSAIIKQQRRPLGIQSFRDPVLRQVRAQRRTREKGDSGGDVHKMKCVEFSESATLHPGVMGEKTTTTKPIGGRRRGKCVVGFVSSVMCVIAIVKLKKCLKRLTSFEYQQKKKLRLQTLYKNKYEGVDRPHGENNVTQHVRNMNMAFKNHIMDSQKALTKARTGKRASLVPHPPVDKKQQDVFASFLPDISKVPQKSDIPFLNLNVGFIDNPLEHNLAHDMSKTYNTQSQIPSRLVAFVKTVIPVNPDDAMGLPIHSEALVFPSFKKQLQEEVEKFSDRTLKEVHRLVEATVSAHENKRKCLFQTASNTKMVSDLRTTLARETSRDLIAHSFQLRVKSNMNWLADFKSRVVTTNQSMSKNVSYCLSLLSPCYERDKLNAESLLHCVVSRLSEAQLMDIDVQFILFHTCHCFGVTKETLSTHILREKYGIPTLVLEEADKKRFLEYNNMEKEKVERDRRCRKTEATVNLRIKFEHMFSSLPKL